MNVQTILSYAQLILMILLIFVVTKDLFKSSDKDEDCDCQETT